MQVPFVGLLNDPDYRQSGTVAFAYPAFRLTRRSAQHPSHRRNGVKFIHLLQN
jgi:hypothetical protein